MFLPTVTTYHLRLGILPMRGVKRFLLKRQAYQPLITDRDKLAIKLNSAWPYIKSGVLCRVMRNEAPVDILLTGIHQFSQLGSLKYRADSRLPFFQ
jgi:hypothetical protein